jgi:UDPglucose 6-dehydrogenase
MHVAVIGSGYVGLVAGACLAETGNDVVCVDKDREKIARLQRNEIPIYEPGLEPMVQRNQAEGRLTFTTDIAEAVKSARVIFIAVGTPPGEDGSADLQHVLGVAREIGRHMNAPKIVVTKSTVPVGTAEKVRAAVKSETSIDFAVCSNPEFLKEGAAIEDFMRPDRVVVGVDSDEAKTVMAELYAPFTRQGGNRIIFMDIASAEVTKYAANAMLATRISFMNQMALFCELVGADVHNVRLGIGSDQRIGRAFLYPGPGYGGSCFPKDVKAIIRTADDLGLSLDVLKSVEAVNECQKLVVLDIV